MGKIIIRDDTCTQIIMNFSLFVFFNEFTMLSSLKVEIRYDFTRPLTEYLDYYKQVNDDKIMHVTVGEQ